MELEQLLLKDMFDPVSRALSRSSCFLRSYQADALRNIFDAAMAGKGGRFTVTFPRQSGKNEMQAHLEAAVMAANLHRGGSIIKLIPTEKNQGKISTERLRDVLTGQRHFHEPGYNEQDHASNGNDPLQFNPGEKRAGIPSENLLHTSSSLLLTRSRKAELLYGTTSLRCLSASRNAAIVGATADLLLEVDEAQMIPPEKFDREAAPMAASTNAVQVFYGTTWDDQTLLSRETRLSEQQGEADGERHVFMTTAAEVGKEVPEYGRFVREQIERLGRDHPAVRTQFFCEEISDLTSMFTPERIEKMKCGHAPLYGPEKGNCYIFLIDVAGSDEIAAAEKKANGCSDRRDATVVTICEVSIPDGKVFDPKNYIWKVVGRRLYRNLRAEQLEAQICQDIDLWDPYRIIIDHSGLGAMLTDMLTGRYKTKVLPIDITAANKTRMAWEFIAMIDNGRWQEYRGDELNVLQSTFTPGKEAYEILKEPELLQQMFFRELRACRMEPMLNQQTVRWGVKDGTRDHVTGRLLHDDLVMSAALAVFEEGVLPVINDDDGWLEHEREINRIWEMRKRRNGGRWW